MTIETKYDLHQKVFFIPGQLKKVVCAEVIKIEVFLDKPLLGNNGHTNQDEKYVMQGGYGPMNPADIFATKEELLQSL